MNEWNIVALILDKWGLPGLIMAGLAWAAYRFGLHPSPASAAAMTNDTAAAIARLSDKLDARHEEAEAQRKLFSEEIHSLDKRVVRIETKLDVQGK